MVDKLSKQARSALMSRIGQKDTKPEIRVRRFLHAHGLRFRLHRKDLPGRPDIVLPSRRVAVFVHGCFWHQHHGCAKATTPSSNAEFWRTKFVANVRRDRDALEALRALAWVPFVVWECETDDQGLQALYSQIMSIAPMTDRH